MMLTFVFYAVIFGLGFIAGFIWGWLANDANPQRIKAHWQSGYARGFREAHRQAMAPHTQLSDGGDERR